MEKHTPHCPLADVKRLALEGKIRTTATAQKNAKNLGFAKTAMFQEILKLERAEFVKSMTTYNDHTIWQDVYKHNADNLFLYIKLTVIDDVLIVSFKEV